MDIDKKIRYLYMYYLKEGIEDKNVIMSYILDDIGSTIYNTKLIQSIFKEDNIELTEEQKENILRDAKELEEYGYFDRDSYVNILENYLENNESFSIKKAFEYMEYLKYSPDSPLYEDLDIMEESNTGNIYRIMIFVNTACAERRQYVDEKEFEEDCLEIKEVFDSDLACLKYIESMYDLDFDIEEDLSEEESVKEYLNCIEDLNSDPGFGNVLILSIDGPKGTLYDSGMTFEDFVPESYLED